MCPRTERFPNKLIIFFFQYALIALLAVMHAKNVVFRIRTIIRETVVTLKLKIDWNIDTFDYPSGKTKI